ncbi:type II toxin-antitoxin system VapC family toxin [Opitutus sp. ER46]|uniref:type II toxin-antitoxin system VapC family toxin n=1 Tax=Opitutus sp. ER46 TaxID=2161864 RepID=UPI000D300C13|nr:type II toxin-antitoxin system VapC family toxin [Opitutus sp. ER46]PTY01225.1 hypothetical protein DB354_00265 [Opitutus sp. ER46]
MPTIVADTSFLFSLYGSDVNSAAARAWIADSSSPITVTPLNRYELTNAVHFATFRQLITRDEAFATLTAFEADMQAGLLQPAQRDLDAVVEEARTLSNTYTANGGHRSFDILHIGSARTLQAALFLTFDTNQKKLAAAVGLPIGP